MGARCNQGRKGKMQMNSQITEISKVVDLSNVYVIVGVLVIFNIGTIASAFYAAGKIIWWLSKLDSKVAQNTKDVNAAHTTIRELKSNSVSS